jgi:hypothetical protein
MLTIPPRIPQSLSANSSAFISKLLDGGDVVINDVQPSGVPANHATRTRVYKRIR